MSLKVRIEAARGDRPADLVLRGGMLVDVLAGEIRPCDVAISDGWIVGIGERYEAETEIDCRGRWIAPGLIDGHMHVESTMVTVAEFARVAMPRGTVATVFDPHEIGNVHGIDGIRYILGSGRAVPLRTWVMVSSCVPATHMETSGAELDADALAPLFEEEGVLGLAEMMNFPGVVFGDRGVLRKLEAASAGGVVIDGHAPGLRGTQLNAYLVGGPGSDHECTTLQEAREKLEKGMRIMLREASTAKNLEALLPLVTPATERRCCFVTDDRHPADLVSEGHIDHAVRKAIRLGLEPLTAYRMASINTAEWFRLDQQGFGAVAPGWRADLIVLDNLEDVSVREVYIDGRLVAKDGEVVVDLPKIDFGLPQSVHVDLERFPGFRIRALTDGSGAADGTRGPDVRVRVIEIIEGQIVTGRSIESMRIAEGSVPTDPERDLAKLAVVERHGRGGGVGLGFVRGFGLVRGAIAGSVAHDSHNIVIAGVDDVSMRTALEEIVRMGGGLVVADGDRVTAGLALPVAGLMSDRPLAEVAEGVERLHHAYRELGGKLEDPFMSLSFLTLPVIPSLKLTDKGLVDVDRFEIVSLFEDSGEASS